jgi:hypothetical protein
MSVGGGYIEKYPSPWGREISANVVWGENVKKGKRKGRKSERKRRKDQR